MWNKFDLAWAAGFFDGEGTISFRSSKRNTANLSLSIKQVEEEPLIKIKESFKLGKIYGPYTPKSVYQSEYYFYQITGFEKVQFAICLMWPYLCSPKKNQLELALVKAKSMYRNAYLYLNDPPEHGITRYSSYKWKCRCNICCAAKRKVNRHYYDKKVSESDPFV